jgi:hypothetical protein
MPDRPLKIGLTCYPSVGGSGILASEFGAGAGGSADTRFTLSATRHAVPDAGGAAGAFSTPCTVNSYDLFKYPDYTLPLSVKMAEVSCQHGLDVLHVHYAVPHATAAILARAMLPPRSAA